MKWEYCYLKAFGGMVTYVSQDSDIHELVIKYASGLYIDSMLNILGLHRWELVTVNGDPKEVEIAYFKRPKIETKK